MTDCPTDPIEAIIFSALTDARIPFVLGDATPPHLDFHLTADDIHIEVKQFHTPRIAEQMSRAPNVIAVQGRATAHWLARVIRGEHL